jgi:ERCC4-type nuclease
MLQIILDSREQLSVTPSFPFQQSLLPLGDACIQYNSQDCILIERKGYSDFIASLKDGRWENQRIRYYQWREEQPSIRQVFYYLYEPSHFEKQKQPTMYKAFESAKIHLQFRDRFYITTGNNWIPWLESIYHYLQTHPEQIYSFRSISSTHSEYQSTLQLQLAKTQSSNSSLKKKNSSINPLSCYLSQLCCIPGISIQTAKEIQHLYPSFSSLLQMIQTHPTPLLMLQQIPHIGKQLSQTIHTYLTSTNTFLVDSTNSSITNDTTPLEPITTNDLENEEQETTDEIIPVEQLQPQMKKITTTKQIRPRSNVFTKRS